MAVAIARLKELAQSDPTAAPLALLRAETLRACDDPIWERAAPHLVAADLPEGRPVLAGAVFTIERQAADRLLARLSSLAGSGPGGQPTDAAVPLDALDLLEATVNQDGERLDALARQAGMPAMLLGVLGNELALPLLRACGRNARTLVAPESWRRGFCPVCAAWPVLAEVRGVGRERWLHCGRCGISWAHHHLLCAFCGNNDHVTQGYLAGEESREYRQAATCERCRGYLKSVASPIALDPEEVLLKDLTTLDLDLAAASRSYSRPEKPAFDLGVRVKRG